MKVFINRPIPEIGMKMLEEASLQIIMPKNPHLEPDEWISYCKDADAILNVGQNDFDADFFEKCPNIKAIALFSVGFDSVDIDYATQHKIPIGNTPDVLTTATADIAFLLMQSVARKASYYFNKIRKDEWGTFDPMHELGQELDGKTLGVFGLGRIGMVMAERCRKAFGMNIIYHNRNQNKEAEEKLGAKYVSFDELLEKSDVLSIHASFSDEHQGKFNKDAFAKMKPNAIFVNTARGGFHDQKDLYEALQNKEIWGAGLDVTNPEPMAADDPILKLSNVCVLPHIGSATVEARNGMAKYAAENMIAFSRGEKMPHCANPQVYG